MVFIASGFVKLVDPIGTGLIVSEYFRVLFIPFLSPASVYIGILLSLVELLIGLCVLFKIRIKVASTVGLCVMVFYSSLTLFLAIFNPISDCGCFGSAIHLTNWQTFFKNVVLLLCIIPIFIQRNSFNKVASNLVEWIFISFYFIIGLGMSVYSLIKIPIVEFGNFKVGTNILAELDNSANIEKYETIFQYEKGGEVKDFTIDNLPDSTWNFIDSQTKTLGDSRNNSFDFVVTDVNGVDKTNILLNASKQLVICLITNSKSLGEREDWIRMKELADSVTAVGGEFFVLTSLPIVEIDSLVSEYAESRLKYGFSDYNTLISMNRSNGGLIYMNDAIVVKKWASCDINPSKISKILRDDYEMISAKELIYRRLIYELSIIFVLFSLLIIRLVLRIIRKYKL